MTESIEERTARIREFLKWPEPLFQCLLRALDNTSHHHHIDLGVEHLTLYLGSAPDYPGPYKPYDRIVAIDGYEFRPEVSSSRPAMLMLEGGPEFPPEAAADANEHTLDSQDYRSIQALHKEFFKAIGVTASTTLHLGVVLFSVWLYFLIFVQTSYKIPIIWAHAANGKSERLYARFKIEGKDWNLALDLLVARRYQAMNELQQTTDGQTPTLN